MNFNDGVFDFILSTYGEKIKEVLGTTNLAFFFFSDNENFIDKVESYPGMLKSISKSEFNVTILNDYSLLLEEDSTPIFDFNICYADKYKFIKIVTPFLFPRAYDFIISKVEEAEEIFKLLKNRKEDAEVDALPDNKIVGVDLPMLKREVVDFLLNEEFREFCKQKEIKLKRGFVFAGKPGTGKTTSIKWLKKIAKENDINFRRFDDPKDFLENTQEFYMDKKSIFVFEDFDGFLQERDDTGGSPNMFLSKILNTLDGTEEIENVVTIFTTNHPEIFDKALLRPGRIDKLIMFEAPNKDQMIELLNIYIPEYTIYFDLIVDMIKKKTQDVSYAILKGICDDINILAFNKIEITAEMIMSIVESKFTSANKGSAAKKATDYIL